MSEARLKFLSDCPEVIPLIASWLHTEWGKQEPWSNIDKLCEAFSDRLHSGRAPLTLVAFEQAVPIGTASIKLHEMTCYPEYTHWIGEIFVVPQYRGRGHGSKLISKILEIAPAVGVSDLYLYTPDQEFLYSRLGWITMHRCSYQGEEVVVMKRSV